MSTTFGVKIPSTDTVTPIAIRQYVGKVTITFLDSLAELLPDDLEVIPMDNTAQGIYTVGDIKAFNMDFYWQGDPVEVEFGYGRVSPNVDKPLSWYNYECRGEEVQIPAIRVVKNKEWIMSNHFGVGVYKLVNGGWPDYPHFSLDASEFTPTSAFNLDFDGKGFIAHEMKRDLWKKKHQ